MAALLMFTAKSGDMGAWQISRCYQGKPDKDLNGLTNMNPIITMPDLPAATLASFTKRSIARKGAMTPSIKSLEDLPHCPEHLRQPGYSLEVVEAVLRLREEYPR